MAPFSCEILGLDVDDLAVAAAGLGLPLGAGGPEFAVTRR
jgi:hypothetical protein